VRRVNTNVALSDFALRDTSHWGKIGSTFHWLCCTLFISTSCQGPSFFSSLSPISLVSVALHLFSIRTRSPFFILDRTTGLVTCQIAWYGFLWAFQSSIGESKIQASSARHAVLVQFAGQALRTTSVCVSARALLLSARRPFPARSELRLRSIEPKMFVTPSVSLKTHISLIGARRMPGPSSQENIPRFQNTDREKSRNHEIASHFLPTAPDVPFRYRPIVDSRPIVIPSASHR